MNWAVGVSGAPLGTGTEPGPSSGGEPALCSAGPAWSTQKTHFDSPCHIPTWIQPRGTALRISQPPFPTGLPTSTLGLDGEEMWRGKIRWGEKTEGWNAKDPAPGRILPEASGHAWDGNNSAFPQQSFPPGSCVRTHTVSETINAPKLSFLNPIHRVCAAPCVTDPEAPVEHRCWSQYGSGDAAPVLSPASASRDGVR